MGGGGGDAAKSTSIGAVADDSPSPIGTSGDGRDGETAFNHRQRHDCYLPVDHTKVYILHLNTAFRDGVHRWNRSVLSGGERLQQRVINSMDNFTHTTDAKRNGLFHTSPVDLEAAASVLVKKQQVFFFSLCSREQVLITC
jgi:hypothetical protein